MGDIALKNNILAVVTLEIAKVAGGVPIFLASTEEEREKTARYLGRILDASVHDLENGSYIIVAH
jgi:hypothetical protein